MAEAEGNSEKKKGIVTEFKEFLLRGNVVDLAVAVVIGAAFGAVVNALVKDLLTPVIAAIFGKPDFSTLHITINHSTFLYGDFINAVFTFVTVAAAVFFFVVKPMNWLIERRRKGGAPDEASLSDEAQLLSEIRDLLAAGQPGRPRPVAASPRVRRGVSARAALGHGGPRPFDHAPLAQEQVALLRADQHRHGPVGPARRWGRPRGPAGRRRPATPTRAASTPAWARDRVDVASSSVAGPFEGDVELDRGRHRRVEVGDAQRRQVELHELGEELDERGRREHLAMPVDVLAGGRRGAGTGRRPTRRVRDRCARGRGRRAGRPRSRPGRLGRCWRGSRRSGDSSVPASLGDGRRRRRRCR